MTEEQIRKDLEDSLSKDQMAAVTVRLSMPRAVWCDVLRGMLHIDKILLTNVEDWRRRLSMEVHGGGTHFLRRGAAQDDQR